jgi:acetyl-CoA carboxylase carboxyltransferase component
LVKAAIGESIDNETLGGATTHKSGNRLQSQRQRRFRQKKKT